MDFGTLLHMAKKNSETTKNEGKYYQTKFGPPKKESKEKKLSENIQKFLQKQEQEEKERQRLEREKLANLLAKRDEKSKNKIKKMLKVTKSANKSVLDDAVNTEHTAVTMNGPDQPDQDDYGYVSTEANAFYQKYIEKVKDVKEEKGFAPSRPQSLKDLSGTKERVKAAITKEIEEKRSHTRQRVSLCSSATTPKDPSGSIARSYTSKNLYDPEAERREEERKKREEEQKKAKSRKPAPPPMDFQALLKLAEKKQHEPVEIITEVKKKKEPERLLTSKEKRELEERQREKEARERRQRERNGEIPKARTKERERDERKDSSSAGRMEPNGRIPKLNQTPKPSGSNVSAASSKSSNTVPVKPSPHGNNVKNGLNGIKKPSGTSTANSTSANSQSSKSSTSTGSSSKTTNPTPKTSIAQKTSMPISKSSSSASALSSSNSSGSKNPYAASSKSGSVREFPPRDIKSIKPRQFPPPDVQKTRQFPPPDVRRGPSSKQSDHRKPSVAQKRRILDDDDEDEYDSELDDFIDDGDCEEDYSSHIKAIFGYDKSKYRDLDDDDDAAMESNFAQVQREEYISKKIGIQEDLEDMKMEALEKKRKMSNKKQRL